MSTVAHTPGPWEIEFDSRGWPQAIIARADMDTLGGVGRVIRMNGIGLPSSPAALANASLITAAPDMLAALKHAVALGDANLPKFSGRSDPCKQSYDMCVAAIRKAEGQS